MNERRFCYSIGFLAWLANYTPCRGRDLPRMLASKLRIHGIPGMPDWADWFAGELETHKAIIRALGIGCAPVLVKGEKEQFLSWLSWGVESGAVSLPAETGSIRWPSLSLQDLFLPAD